MILGEMYGYCLRVGAGNRRRRKKTWWQEFAGEATRIPLLATYGREQ